jgi:hypothetical protein
MLLPLISLEIRDRFGSLALKIERRNGIILSYFEFKNSPVYPLIVLSHERLLVEKGLSESWSERSLTIPWKNM